MKKMKVLIAEDEPIVARYIKSVVDGIGGFKTVGICESGEEALEKYDSERPDLLITDIRMPGMSGLDLIRAVKEREYDTYTVIISGYKSFEYAKQAIALGVEEYITKPISVSELESTVIRIRQQYNQKEYNKSGENIEKAIRNRSDRDIRFAFPFERFRLIAVYNAGEEPALQVSPDDSPFCTSFIYRNAQVFLNADAGTNAEKWTSRIVQEVSDKQKGRTCTVISIRRTGFSDQPLRDIHNMYRILREHTFPGKYMCLECNDLSDIPAEKPMADDMQMMNLEAAISLKDWKKVQEGLADLFDRWQHEQYSIYRIKTGVHHLTDRLQKEGVFSEGKVEINEYLDDCIHFSAGYSELKESVLGYFSGILERENHNTEEKNDAERLFEKISAFVLQHEDRIIPLNEISGIFGISQPYIRKIFRMNVGRSYNEWIQEIKIGRAKQMILDDPNILIKDVAAKIGYEPLYFSTVFSKYIGMSPTEFRFQNSRNI